MPSSLVRHGGAYVHRSVSIRSVTFGHGLFAEAPLPADEVIFLAAGILVDEALLENQYSDLAHYGWQVEEDLYLLEPIESPERYVNHSCAPNCGAYGQLGLITMRSIAAGEELTYDYAMTQTVPVLFEQCGCGVPQCRKQIRPDDYLLPDLQKRYHGYFSPHIARKLRLWKAPS